MWDKIKRYMDESFLILMLGSVITIVIFSVIGIFIDVNKITRYSDIEAICDYHGSALSYNNIEQINTYDTYTEMWFKNGTYINLPLRCAVKKMPVTIIMDE